MTGNDASSVIGSTISSLSRESLNFMNEVSSRWNNFGPHLKGAQHSRVALLNKRPHFGDFFGAKSNVLRNDAKLAFRRLRRATNHS